MSTLSTLVEWLRCALPTPRRRDRAKPFRSPRRGYRCALEPLETRLAPAGLRAVSVVDDPAQPLGNGHSTSTRFALSSDGTRAVFASDAPNLTVIDGFDNNGVADVFVRNLETGQYLARISQTVGPTPETAQPVPLSEPALSPDGKVVAFVGQTYDPALGVRAAVFVHYLQTGQTTLVSQIGPVGAESHPSLSADGRFVAFESAVGLVTIDTNTVSDVYVMDLQDGHLVLASSTAQNGVANAGSQYPSIAGDGVTSLQVVFKSSATNLIAEGPATAGIYKKNIKSGELGLIAPDDEGGSVGATLSADGKHVAYTTTVGVSGLAGAADVVVMSLESGAVVRANTTVDGVKGNGPAYNPALSADGRFVAFESAATNLVAGDTNGLRDIFVKDVVTGQVWRATTGPGGPANALTRTPAVSGDGRRVAFTTQATNLIGDTRGKFNVGLSLNAAPTAGADAYAVTEDVPLTVPAPGVLANDPDGDATTVGTMTSPGDALTVRLVTGPTHGTLDLRPDGSFTYTPALHYFGPDSFVYEAVDPFGAQARATVTLTVAAVNDAPVAQPGSLDVTLNTPADGTAVATDVDDVSLTYLLVGQPAHGSVVFRADGTYTYTPHTGYTGGDGFTFKVTDGKIESNVATIGLTVAGTNHAPVAEGRTDVTVNQNAAVTFFVSASDPDGDVLTYTFTNPGNGSVVRNPNGSFTYTPAAGYVGADSFTFRVSDGKLISGAATVGIAVNAVNRPPTAAPLPPLDVNMGAPARGITLAEFFADPDGDGLTFTVMPGDTNLVTHSLANGVLTLHFAAAVPQDDDTSLTVTASDGRGGQASATFVVFVRAVNRPPVAQNSTLTAFRDTPAQGTVRATDADNDQVSYELKAAPLHGDVTISAGGGFTYTPHAGHVGADSFTFLAKDGRGGSATGTVTVDVKAVNRPPTVVSPLPDRLDLVEDMGTVTIPLAGVFADPDGDNLQYTVTVVVPNTQIRLTTLVRAEVGNGQLKLTPLSNQAGTAEVVVQATDPALLSVTDRFIIRVNPVNDAPVAPAGTLTVDEDTEKTGSFGATDVDGGTLTYRIVRGPANGTVTPGANGTYTYRPSANYPHGAVSGADSFTYEVNDGRGGVSQGTVQVTVRAVNDAPTVTAPSAVRLLHDRPLLLSGATQIRVGDIDAGAGTLKVTLGARRGTLALNSTAGLTNFSGLGSATVVLVGRASALNAALGGLTFRPQAKYVSTTADPAYINVTVSDQGNTGIGGALAATRTVTLNVVNTRPAIRPEYRAGRFYVAPANRLLTIPATSGLARAFTDADGDALALKVTLSPMFKGTLRVNADGSFTYDPPRGFRGRVTFTVRATDGLLDSDPLTVTLTVASL